jgi:hypothetical protein
MRGQGSQDLQFDPEIEKTAKANRKAAREARVAAHLAGLAQGTSEIAHSSSSSFDEESVEEEIEIPIEEEVVMAIRPRRTLGDYGQRANGTVANLGFQPANPVAFDMKNSVLSALKENQYAGLEAQFPISISVTFMRLVTTPIHRE